MTGLILLAAGASTRLGRPKQTLSFEGNSLLQRAIQTALDSVCAPVLVVLGANAAQTAPELAGLPVHQVLNPAWSEGMASSIRAGIKALQQLAPAVQETIFMVCDQPYVTADLLNQLIQTKVVLRKDIVACAYNHTFGTPALFDKKYFEELSALQGPEGAKKLFSRHPEEVVSIPFPQGAVDIDTLSDYESLTAQA